eukprot:1152289-Pelagomonas_calceolata.AAC.2
MGRQQGSHHALQLLMRTPQVHSCLRRLALGVPLADSCRPLTKGMPLASQHHITGAQRHGSANVVRAISCVDDAATASLLEGTDLSALAQIGGAAGAAVGLHMGVVRADDQLLVGGHAGGLAAWLGLGLVKQLTQALHEPAVLQAAAGTALAGSPCAVRAAPTALTTAARAVIAGTTAAIAAATGAAQGNDFRAHAFTWRLHDLKGGGVGEHILEAIRGVRTSQDVRNKDLHASTRTKELLLRLRCQ